MGRTARSLALAAAALAVLAVPSAEAAGLAFDTGKTSSKLRVWVSNANGTHARKLARGGLPMLSPNGKLVAFSLFGARRPTAIRVVSSNGVAVAKISGYAYALAWSRDSRYLAVNDSTGGGSLIIVDTKLHKTRMVAHGVVLQASFAPSGPDRLVFGLSTSGAFNAPTNLYTIDADGTHKTQLTDNGEGAYPVWGKLGIAFTHVTLRGFGHPEYQVYLLSGGVAKQITNLAIPANSEGLTPLAVSSDGANLVAAYQTIGAPLTYTVNLETGAVVQLTDGTVHVNPWGISRNGKRVLVDLGENLHSRVATMPFSGGSPSILVVHAGQPSWNR
jgi:Tol biopolymer transport system component